MTGPSEGAVAIRYLLADDGAAEPIGLHDVAAAVACAPELTAEGVRCMPLEALRADRGRFADARCSESAATSFAFVACPSPQGNRFVLTGPLSSPSGRIHRVGELLARGFEKRGETCVPATDSLPTYTSAHPFRLPASRPSR